MKLTPTAKKYLFSAAAVLVMVGGTVGVASAHMGKSDDAEFAKALATRFNLDQSQVQTFLTEQQTARMAAMHAQMKVKVEARLTKLVAAGKLTEAQKQLVITKMTEVETRMVAIQAMTDVAARKTALQTLHAEVKAWATQNNIPLGVIQSGLGKEFGGMHGKEGMGKAMNVNVKVKAPKANR